MNAIEFHKVSKKFRKGEKFDSLRDLIFNLLSGTRMEFKLAGGFPTEFGGVYV